MSAFAGLRLAVGLLSTVPVRPPERIGRGEARTAMLLAPVAVLPIAVLAGLAGWAATWLGLPGLLSGGLAVLALTLGTRAMHQDGLADTVDGLGSGRETTRALEIMRQGDVGPMGTTALVLSLLLQAAAAGAILERQHGWLLLVVLVCLSRTALLAGCAVGVLPAARPEGLGALVSGSVGLPAAVLTWLVWTAAACGVALLGGRPAWLPVAGALLAAAGCTWLVRRSVKRLGGITGDVLGALVEVAATLLLVVAAVPGQPG